MTTPLAAAFWVGVLAALVNAVVAIGSACFSGATNLFGGNVGALLAQARTHLWTSSLLVGAIAFLAVLLYAAFHNVAACNALTGGSASRHALLHAAACH